MAEPIIERTTEIRSQNRIYTKQTDRQAGGFEPGDSCVVEFADAAEGYKQYEIGTMKMNADGEFFLPKEKVDALDLKEGDEIIYRVF